MRLFAMYAQQMRDGVARVCRERHRVVRGGGVVGAITLAILVEAIALTPTSFTHNATSINPPGLSGQGPISGMGGYEQATLTKTRTVPTNNSNNSTPLLLAYRAGYSVQGPWLCYGWRDGSYTYHCTQRWTLQNGVYISYNARWVPSQGTTPTATVTTPTTTTTSTVQTAGQPCRDAIHWPSTITQWSIPSGCYANIYTPNPQNYVARPSYGWCNWWPEVLQPWRSGTDALHLASHATPRAGATVFFWGNVQGASSEGHYAQVVAVSPGGYWVLITEMNFYWRGGGWAKVDYRYIHVGSGVEFRY